MSKLNKILIISNFIPVKGITNAGSYHVADSIEELTKAGFKVYLWTNYFSSDVAMLHQISQSVERIYLNYSTDNSRFFNLVKFLLSVFNPILIYWKPGDWARKKEILEIVKTNNIELINMQWSAMVRFSRYIRRRNKNLKIVTFMHDLDVEYLLRRLPNHWMIRKLGYYYFKRIDQYVVNKSDIVMVPSKKDGDNLFRIVKASDRKKINIVHFNIELFFDLEPPIGKKVVGFFGNMARPENYLAVEWFLNNVWNEGFGEGRRFLIAGGGLPESIARYIDAIKGVEYMGFVEDLKSFIIKCDLFVAPLEIGGGVKFKVLQALSAGRIVLGSHIAYEGIDLLNEIPKCETPEEYNKILNLIDNNSNYANKLANAGIMMARKYIEDTESMSEFLVKIFLCKSI